MLKLEKHETTSAVWKKIEAHIGERLQVARETNDNSLDELKTATLRGEISTYKKLLDIGKPEQYV